MPKQLEKHRAAPSGVSCPECCGVLEVRLLTSEVPQFRCRIGHVYGAAELLGGKEQEAESRLWCVLACLEELEALLVDLPNVAPGTINGEPAGRRAAEVRRLRMQLQPLVEKNRSMAVRKDSGFAA